MKSLVVYDSFFGNTEKLAQAVSKVLGTEKTVSIVRVAEMTPDKLEGVDLLVVASPTRGFRPSEGTTKFLNSLPAGALAGVQAAVFDTRIDVDTIKNKVFHFIVKRGGYANKIIADVLKKKGAVILQPIEGFYVDESEGPLTNGEVERAERWAGEIKAAVK